MFSAGDTERCFIVGIVDDEVNENTETFQITARFQNSVTTDASTYVTVTDDDGRIDIHIHIYPRRSSH